MEWTLRWEGGEGLDLIHWTLKKFFLICRRPLNKAATDYGCTLLLTVTDAVRRDVLMQPTLEQLSVLMTPVGRLVIP